VLHSALSLPAQRETATGHVVRASEGD
jgi:hypothetical protein